MVIVIIFKFKSEDPMFMISEDSMVSVHLGCQLLEQVLDHIGLVLLIDHPHQLIGAEVDLFTVLERDLKVIGGTNPDL